MSQPVDEFLVGFRNLQQQVAQANATAAELSATGRTAVATAQAQAPTLADAASRAGYGIQQGGAGIQQFGRTAPGFAQGLQDAAQAGRQGAATASSAVKYLKIAGLFLGGTLVVGTIGLAAIEALEARQ